MQSEQVSFSGHRAGWRGVESGSERANRRHPAQTLFLSDDFSPEFQFGSSCLHTHPPDLTHVYLPSWIILLLLCW